MNRNELITYLDSYLRIGEIKDYGPQGLQIEGRVQVRKIVGAVDCHQPVVDQALAHGADLLLVHHGLFWGEEKLLRGAFGKLVRTAMLADLNLYAAHLVLDAHPEVGNNAELARRLGLNVIGWFGKANGTLLGAQSEAATPVEFSTLVERYTATVGPVNLAQQVRSEPCKRIGIISGLASRFVDEAVQVGCDTFITGETSHAHYYNASNLGINILYGGHYASETVGVQALGQHLQAKFGVEFEFIDLPTGL